MVAMAGFQGNAHVAQLQKTRAWLSNLRRSLAFPVAISLVVILVMINELTYADSQQAMHEMEVAQIKRTTMNVVLQRVLDAETGQRGYLLTGKKEYLEPFNRAAAGLESALKTLRELYAATPEDRNNAAHLSQMVLRKMSELELTIRLRDLTSDRSQWLAIVEADIGKRQMDEIRTQATEMIARATQERRLGMERAIRSQYTLRLSILVTALLGLLAFYFYLRQSKRLVTVTQSQKAWLSQENLRLEKLVQERTATLTELATHLQELQEKEREHLARELHDELGALLTAAKLDLARVKSKLPAGSDLHERLRHLSSTLNEVIALKRRIIEDLRPSSLSKLGLGAALEILIREFQERTRINIVTNFEEVRLNDVQELCIYRVVQESLTNIAKYAGATEVSIALLSYPHHVELKVHDNGKGFDTATRLSASHGLVGMRHRVQALKGQLVISSEKGKGTQVYAELPRI